MSSKERPSRASHGRLYRQQVLSTDGVLAVEVEVCVFVIALVVVVVVEVGAHGSLLAATAAVLTQLETGCQQRQQHQHEQGARSDGDVQ